MSLRKDLVSSALGGEVVNWCAVGGGCDAEAYRAEIGERKVFVKFLGAGLQDKVNAEVKGLEAMRALVDADDIAIPRVLASSKDGDDESWICEEFLEMRSRISSADAEKLGRGLAKLHDADVGTTQFGFEVTTWCGESAQDNTFCDDWPTFFFDHRLRPLARIVDNDELNDLIQRVEERSEDIFKGAGEIRPSLLHGDLWTGNISVDVSSDTPVLFDPACYYGHWEAELSIMDMFGAPPRAFYTSYFRHKAGLDRPPPGYERRQHLYKAYHYLNHWKIFGGSYAHSTMSSLSKCLEP